MLLVTGITGHTGKYFLQQLKENKYEIPLRCIIRETSDTTLLDNCNLKIEKYFGNLNDADLINKAMVGIEQVMHIYNIHHSPMIVDAAIKNKVKKVILVHTTGIYSEFKYASEEYIKIEENITNLINKANGETEIIILRPAMIYGDICDKNMSKFIKMIDILPVIPIINGGNNLIQPVNAKDLGKALYDVLTFKGKLKSQSYDLTGDRPIKLLEVFELISKNMNKKVYYLSIPLNLGVFFAKTLKLMTLYKIDFVEKVQRMGENRSYSHQKAHKDFGYTPMRFEEGIQREVSQYLEKKTKPSLQE